MLYSEPSFSQLNTTNRGILVAEMFWTTQPHQTVLKQTGLFSVFTTSEIPRETRCKISPKIYIPSAFKPIG